MSSSLFRIFISYRRDDARGYAGWLEERLEDRFGRGSVFLDVGDIGLGSKFPEQIKAEIDRSDVVLCLIGSRWRGLPDGEEVKPRIHHPLDWVRIEVATALKAEEKMVIPILLDGVVMPTARELPPSLKSLPALQGHPMGLGTWKRDLEGLLGFLDDVRLQRETGKLTGSEILDRFRSETDVPAWVGRNGGPKGALFRRDVDTLGWKDQEYEVLFGGSRPNKNWFPIKEFASAVKEEGTK